MVGLLCLAGLYIGKLKRCQRSKQSNRPKVRRWRRYELDLPVRVIAAKAGGASRVFAPARGTAVSSGGMALYVDLPLKRDDAIEVEFQPPSKLLVTGIVRSQANHCFGLEFLTPLRSKRTRRVLLNRTRDRREHVIGVRTDEPDRTDDDHQNHRQHHRILSDVLTFISGPNRLKKVNHVPPPVGNCKRNRRQEGWGTAEKIIESKREVAGLHPNAPQIVHLVTTLVKPETRKRRAGQAFSARYPNSGPIKSVDETNAPKRASIKKGAWHAISSAPAVASTPPTQGPR